LGNFHDQFLARLNLCVWEREQDLNILSENDGGESEEGEEDRAEELHSGRRCRCFRVEPNEKLEQELG
jgi:hypothetical protein